MKERGATCFSVMTSLVVIESLLLLATAKRLYFTGFVGDIYDQMKVFLDIQTNNDAVVRAGVAIFQYIYRAPGTNLGAIRYNVFSRKAAAAVIKPETLPPTEGAAARHSLRAYLQTRDWMLLLGSK